MTRHQPILVEPIIAYICENLAQFKEGGILIDCTFGGGGHSSALLSKLSEFPDHFKLLGFDRDENALTRARQDQRFQKSLETGRLELHHTRFGALPDSLIQGRHVVGILADLGFSSDQIETADRGLSFQLQGPLDMRMGLSEQSAWDILQTYSEMELQKIFSEFGEEKFSGRIARCIVDSRRDKTLPQTTTEFAEWVRLRVPKNYRFGRIHPATRVFQALRIEVNGELQELDFLLNSGIMKLQAGGRVAILSFHSLEDRMVKYAFRQGSFKALTKKPLEANDTEVQKNPRSRSAKLRVAQKI